MSYSSNDSSSGSNYDEFPRPAAYCCQQCGRCDSARRRLAEKDRQGSSGYL